MFTADYKLAGWVYKLIGFMVIAITVFALTPAPAEAFIFRAIGRGLLGAGRLVGRAAFGVGRLGLGAVRGAGRLVLGTGRFLAGGPFFARRFSRF